MLPQRMHVAIACAASAARPAPSRRSRFKLVGVLSSAEPALGGGEQQKLRTASRSRGHLKPQPINPEDACNARAVVIGLYAHCQGQTCSRVDQLQDGPGLNCARGARAGLGFANKHPAFATRL